MNIDKIEMSTDLARQYSSVIDYKGTVNIKTPFPIDHVNYKKKEIESKKKKYVLFVFKAINKENLLK